MIEELQQAVQFHNEYCATRFWECQIRDGISLTGTLLWIFLIVGIAYYGYHAYMKSKLETREYKRIFNGVKKK